MDSLRMSDDKPLIVLCPNCSTELRVNDREGLFIQCCNCGWRRNGRDYIFYCLGGAKLGQIKESNNE
jgi:hypothetical protein